jgi:hypothetical protein
VPSAPGSRAITAPPDAPRDRARGARRLACRTRGSGAGRRVDARVGAAAQEPRLALAGDPRRAAARARFPLPTAGVVVKIHRQALRPGL